MDDGELYACESPRGCCRWRDWPVVLAMRLKSCSNVSPELFCLVHQWLASVHGLHAQDLIVTLLVVEHAAGEIVKDILICQGPISLGQKCEQTKREVITCG